MSDYNDFLLPDPCLRMDTHFGDEYESVEFGDGTGYIKAAPTLARLGALHVELDELRDENAKLRELAKLTVFIIETMESVTSWRFEGDGKVIDSAYLWDKLRELGVEVDR